MRVFVTGGNGFIGSRVVRQLVAAGHQVRCLLRPTSDTRRIDRLPLERVIGDLLDRESLDRGVADQDAVIHLAGISSWHQLGDDALQHRVTVDGTGNLLAAIAASSPRPSRLVYVSSAAAIGGTETAVVQNEDAEFTLPPDRFAYAASKRTAERLCFDADIDTVVVNPTEVYGPEDHDLVTAATLRDIVRSWPALAVHGGLSVAQVDDVAAGIVAALTAPPEHRYILGGENLTIREFVTLVLRLAGRRTPVITLPNGLARSLIATLAALRLPTPMPPVALRYATKFWLFESRRAEESLLYQKRPAQETLATTLSWLKDSKLLS